MMTESNTTIELTVIFPAYNEEENIEKCIKETTKTINKLNVNYEIIIAENGSTDKTLEIIKKLSEKFPVIQYIHLDEPNPSAAIRSAYSIAKGKTIVNLDVDLSTDMSYFKQLFDLSKNYDIVTGSRYLDKKLVKRTADRLFLSKVFNIILIRGLLRSKLKDNNCGFRAIKKEIGKELYNEIKDDYVFGIVEIMIRAQRKGYSIKEFPVKWTENPRRIGIKKIFRFLVPALKLWVELR